MQRLPLCPISVLTDEHPCVTWPRGARLVPQPARHRTPHGPAMRECAAAAPVTGRPSAPTATFPMEPMGERCQPTPSNTRLLRRAGRFAPQVRRPPPTCPTSRRPLSHWRTGWSATRPPRQWACREWTGELRAQDLQPATSRPRPRMTTSLTVTIVWPDAYPDSWNPEDVPSVLIVLKGKREEAPRSGTLRARSWPAERQQEPAPRNSRFGVHP